MNLAELYAETVTLPRALRFPVELRPPEGFVIDDPATWPRLAGRLEYVDGRLLFMPPCGDEQQDTVTDVVITLGTWARAHTGWVLGTNEAGMYLQGSVRGADAALWRRADLGAYSGGLRRVPPVLAVEIAGQDDDEPALREKAAWYLAHGVEVVWLLLPAERAAIVVIAAGARRFERGQRLPEVPALPGLTPEVAELFRQLDER